MNPIERHMAADLAGETPAGLDPLVDTIRARCGTALRAVVLYGSTRRNGNARDGLVDLMAIVRDYRSVHGAGPTALFNYLLPPNVYYLETGPESARVRCKYIIVSERAFAARTRGGLDGYFWARFTQPCRLVWRADTEAGDAVANCRAAAAARFAHEAVGLGGGDFTAGEFWARALSATYACELRPEPPGAARALIDCDPGFWRGLSAVLLPGLEQVSARDGRYRVGPGRWRRIAGRIRWAVRRPWGKSLNVLRLLKAAGTFANGIDYLSWKIERHTGVRVETTERMRRHPRLASWKLLFRLWRTGALG